MKKILNLQVLFALLVATMPLAATAQITTYFTDNFSNGSTTNLASVVGGSPTASYTSYDIGANKTTIGYVAIKPNDLTLKLSAGTTSGYLEAQALFVTNSVGGTNAIALSQPGDYIDIQVVFTNTGGTLLAGGVKSSLWIGLYNSGGNAPVSGGALANSGLTTTSGSAYATGNCQLWQGYAAEITSSGTTRIVTRPVQNDGTTTSANQELLGNNASGGTFDHPGGTAIDTAPTAAVTLTSGGQYTLELRITLAAANSLTISNFIYNGAGTNGTVVFSQGSAPGGVTNGTFLTGAFDGLAIGAFNSGTSFNPTMDISSILITGTNTVVTTPPTITSQPVSVTVATNGACAFSVSAQGFSLAYQWGRNGTNLLNQGNISGANSSLLVITNAGFSDVLSTNNGYYCTVSGANGYSTNSVTNSLTLVPATNLIWTDDQDDTWDLNVNSVHFPNWQDTNGNSQVFNYGDPVTFNDVGFGANVILSGQYLSAASVTVNSTYSYGFQGGGSFAGPGRLIYDGTGQLTLNNANTYSGGTIISNANAYLLLENYAGLGTGPVTLALAGGLVEIATTGGASTGIGGDIVAADNFSIQLDGLGTYSGVFLGNLAGTAGKTLRLAPIGSNTSTNARVRVYGANETNYANLWLDSSNDTALISLAPYNASGNQTYNGVISGTGALVQRGAGTTILNGANTYSGGTTATAGGIGLGIDSDGTPTYGPIGTGPLIVAPETGSASGSGTVLAVNGAHTIANPVQYLDSTNNQTLIFGGTNALTFTGTYALQGQLGAQSPTNRVVQVSNTNSLATISGVISDGGFGFGFSKTGPGVLALNNTETYTGSTIASAGTLQVNGQLNAASAVTVSTNATIAGSGAINGAVTINAGGILAPGAASIGTLTVNNNLTNSGNLLFRVNKSLSPSQSNDIAVVTGILTNTGTGTLTVSNFGPALVLGDRFVLFSKALANGGALTITNQPALSSGLALSNSLAIDGSVKVIAVSTVLIPTNSAHITSFSLASTNLVINATNGQSGGTYYLLASTNMASPLGQWTAVATNIVNTNGASGAFTFTGTNVASPGAGQKFYILSNTNN